MVQGWLRPGPLQYFSARVTCSIQWALVMPLKDICWWKKWHRNAANEVFDAPAANVTSLMPYRGNNSGQANCRKKIRRWLLESKKHPSSTKVNKLWKKQIDMYYIYTGLVCVTQYHVTLILMLWDRPVTLCKTAAHVRPSTHHGWCSCAPRSSASSLLTHCWPAWCFLQADIHEAMVPLRVRQGWGYLTWSTLNPHPLSLPQEVPFITQVRPEATEKRHWVCKHAK